MASFFERDDGTQTRFFLSRPRSLGKSFRRKDTPISDFSFFPRSRNARRLNTKPTPIQYKNFIDVFDCFISSSDNHGRRSGVEWKGTEIPFPSFFFTFYLFIYLFFYEKSEWKNENYEKKKKKKKTKTCNVDINERTFSVLVRTV